MADRIDLLSRRKNVLPHFMHCSERGSLVEVHEWIIPATSCHIFTVPFRTSVSSRYTPPSPPSPPSPKQTSGAEFDKSAPPPPRSQSFCRLLLMPKYGPSTSATPSISILAHSASYSPILRLYLFDCSAASGSASCSAVAALLVSARTKHTRRECATHMGLLIQLEAYHCDTYCCRGLQSL